MNMNSVVYIHDYYIYLNCFKVQLIFLSTTGITFVTHGSHLSLITPTTGVYTSHTFETAK